MLRFFNRKLHNRKGFTLIELIVVIAILAILAVIAIPRLSGFTTTAKLNADYSTAATIGHAAQAYLVDNDEPETGISVATLTGEALLPATTRTTLQSDPAKSFTIVVTGGDVSVTDGTDTLYPKP
jgi:prepilin-type N-terminal cleavage/methylation domain-containing protein